MDIGPLEDLTGHEAAGRLEKHLAGGNAVTFSAFGHRAVAIPIEELQRRPIQFESEGVAGVVLPLELYESLAETLEVMDDPDAMAALRDAKAATGDDLTVEQIRKRVAERNE